MNFTIPCLFGLESLVADELKRLGLQDNTRSSVARRRTSPG